MTSPDLVVCDMCDMEIEIGADAVEEWTGNDVVYYCPGCAEGRAGSMTPLSEDLLRRIVHADGRLPLTLDHCKRAGSSNSGHAYGVHIDDVGSHHEERYGEVKHPSHGFSIQFWSNRVEVTIDYIGNRRWDGIYFFTGPRLVMRWRFTHRQWVKAMELDQGTLFDV